MNILEAINAHVSWKFRLKRYIEDTSDETLDPAEVARDDCCALGQWLKAEEGRFAAKPLYRQVVEDHAEFHRIAAEVVRRHRAGDSSGARNMLEAEYARCSHKITQSLARLEKTLSGGGQPITFHRR